MSGARNRQRGHDWEVLIANELSDALGLDLKTGRFFGLHYGADIVTVTGYDAKGRPATFDPEVLGWSLELKAVKRRVPVSWLRQAQEQMAPGLTPVVLWKRPNKGWRDGSAFLIDSDSRRGWSEQTIGGWLDGVMANLSERDGAEKKYGIAREEGLDELVRVSEDAGLYGEWAAK